MTEYQELEKFSNKNLRLLRRAVRKALRQHYKADEYIVYSKNGKIYRTNKPGTKGTVVSSGRSKSA